MIASNYFLLNLVWLAGCIPLVTIFSSTVSMFSVIRNWENDRDDAVFMPFIRSFATDFLQTFGTGILWLGIGALIAVNIFIVSHMEGALQVVLTSLNVLAAVVFVVTSIYVFPLLAGYKLRSYQAFHYGFILGFGRPITSLKCLVGLLILAALTYFAILPIFFAGSLGALIVFRLCQPVLESFEPGKGT